MTYSAPKGTEDLLPEKARSWNRFTQIADEVFSCYGYEPVETPIFENTDLFVRGCGETSDVATKEMFSVFSMGALASLKADEPLKASQRLALRPEGTASVVRAIAQHNLVPQGAAPAKLYYAGPMFRSERPQKGRLRQFHQVGVECLGATDALADAEMIIMCMRFYAALGIPEDSMELLINSMGDDNCRPAYTEAVKSFMHEHEDDFCEDCRRRMDSNPLRSFDCKNEKCHEIMDSAPRFSDYLCEECDTRYKQVKAYLDAAGVSYREDPRLVRGFDYYTGTVFEVQASAGLGSQSAIGGGGHYDKLMAEVSGHDLSGLGFAVGFERIMLLLEALGVSLIEDEARSVYIVCVDDAVRMECFTLLQQLRDAGIPAQCDTQGRSVKSQFKVAGKSNARLCITIGPDEVAAGKVTVRDMDTHDELEAPLCGVVSVVQSKF